MTNKFAQDIEEYLHKYALVFENVYNKVRKAAQDKLNDMNNIMEFLITAMYIVSQHPELHGCDKKELVRDVIAKVIDDMSITDEDKAHLKHIFPFLDHIVDVLIAAAKGRLFLAKVGHEIEEYVEDTTECVGGCVGGCFKKTFGKCKGKCQDKCTKKAKTVARPKFKDIPIEAGAIDDMGVLIYDKLKSMITTKQINMNNIMTIVGIVMQLVQQYPALTGEQKKQIVKNVVYKLVNDLPLSDSDRLSLLGLLNATLDKTIDYIIAVASGQIDIIGQIVDTAEKISNGCSRLCTKKQ